MEQFNAPEYQSFSSQNLVLTSKKARRPIILIILSQIVQFFFNFTPHDMSEFTFKAKVDYLNNSYMEEEKQQIYGDQFTLNKPQKAHQHFDSQSGRQLGKEERKDLTHFEAMRLNTLLQSLPQLHDEGMLMRLYVRHEREDPGLKSQLPFWREAIDRLYREVFMRIDIPRYLIKQAFVIYGQVPASLDNIIDELLSQGNLIRRDEALRNIKSKSWIQQAQFLNSKIFFSRIKQSTTSKQQLSRNRNQIHPMTDQST